jgi:hypothetical protein
MKLLATLAAGIAISAATIGAAATAHAGGPPNDGGGGGGAPAGAPGHCSDADLTVTNGPIESANTLRRVVVTQTWSPRPAACWCTSRTGRPMRRMCFTSTRATSRMRTSSRLRWTSMGREILAHAKARWWSRRLAIPCRTNCPSRYRFATRPSAQWINSFDTAGSIVRLRLAARLADELQ